MTKKTKICLIKPKTHLKKKCFSLHWVVHCDSVSVIYGISTFGMECFLGTMLYTEHSLLIHFKCDFETNEMAKIFLNQNNFVF